MNHLDRGVTDGCAHGNVQPCRRWAIDSPMGPPEGRGQGLQGEEVVRGGELTESDVV